MKTVEEYKKDLEVLKKKQKDNESEVMRAQFAQEEAKKRVLEASKDLKAAGFTTIPEAEAEVERLKTEIEENMTKAQEILGL